MFRGYLFIAFLSAAMFPLLANTQDNPSAGVDPIDVSFFILPADAPEQMVVQEAQAMGLPVPRIALVPPEMVRIYAENGRAAADAWCAERASTDDCIQAATTLQEGPFINHEKGRIWLHTSLPLSQGKSAPMLRELARQIGAAKARQVIIAHEIAHVAFLSVRADQLESAARSGFGDHDMAGISRAMFYDNRFREAFCNYFGVILVARLATQESADEERQRIARGLAEALRVFYEGNRFYIEMANALDDWTSSGVSAFKDWEMLAVHAVQQTARLSLDNGWTAGD